MKPTLKLTLLLVFGIFILVANSCTDIDDNLKLVNAEEVIKKDSDLYQILQNVTTTSDDPLVKITCIDFIYPLTLQIYDTDLQVIGTITIVGDDNFSAFLGDLPDNQSISISYPIATTLADGTVFSVANNTELKIAIDNCSKEDIISYCGGLFGGSPHCVWIVPYFEDADNKYSGGIFDTNNDGTLHFDFDGTTYNGTWTFLYVNNELHININLEGDSDTANYWNIDRRVHFNNDKIIIENFPKNYVLQQKCETLTPYAIGATGPAGGMVFYDKGAYSHGWRYMEISTTDSGFFEWGCLGSDIENTAVIVGKGLYNSAAIAGFHDNLDNYYMNPSVCNVANNGTVAAKNAVAFHVTGFDSYDDWFLPSQEELLAAYQNLHLAALGNFTADYYWSSTAFDANNAIAISFVDGSVNAISKIPTANIVKTRAVRYF
ncbi:MAG: hypothetical protein PSV16_14005 [Flavobacterium sp.]|nr:hypothetical protein [Flavobacterium sp.]